jgi:hypothetical protein
VTITCALRASRAFLLELFFLADAPIGNVKSKTTAATITSEILTDFSIIDSPFSTKQSAQTDL